MQPISNSDGSDGGSEESGKAGNTKSPAEIKQFFKDLIAKANSVPLKVIFKSYGIGASEHTSVITCPFTKHSNGRERTPSFQFFPKTNTFWCYGCKTGNNPVDLVAAMENISKAKAAYKIINLHGSEVTSDNADNDISVNYSEYLEILMDFSDFIRGFIQSHSNDPLGIKYIEMLASAFDSLNTKYHLDNTAIKNLIIKLKNKANNYTPRY